jgi:hypothetical protein
MTYLNTVMRSRHGKQPGYRMEERCHLCLGPLGKGKHRCFGRVAAPRVQTGFIPAEEYLAEQRKAKAEATITASLADLAANHVASVVPIWAASRAVQGMLGCIVRVKSLCKPVSITMGSLRHRQEMDAVI